MRRIVRSMRTATIAWVVAVAPLHAQDYPAAPVRIISGFSAGTTADLSARIVGAKMGEILGQQFVVENRLGAASSLAAAAVARAPKDGYTLFLGSAANLINAAMNPNLNFDFVTDFAPVTLLTSTPTVLVVNPELGVKSVAELVARAKDKPDTILFGSSGVASSTHLALELFKSLAQANITHVPYSGSPPVITDLLAGRIHGYFAPGSGAAQHVAAGRMLALAVTDAARNPIFPDLSTMIEAGVPGFESVLWFGLVAPAGTPQAVIDKLSRAANEALKSDDVVKLLKAQSVTAVGGSPEDFRRYIEAENKRWTGVVANAGLKQ